MSDLSDGSDLSDKSDLSDGSDKSDPSSDITKCDTPAATESQRGCEIKIKRLKEA